MTSPAAASLQHLGWGSSALDADAVRAMRDGATCARLVDLRFTIQATVEGALVTGLVESPRTPRLWAIEPGIPPGPLPGRRAVVAPAW